MIEYDLVLPDHAHPRPRLTLVGKVRARKLDRVSSEILTQLRQAGFDDESPDGISVPRPFSAIPELHMTLQEKVSGTPLTDLLRGPHATRLMGRVAEAVHKLHQTTIQVARHHTLADEIRILEDRLGRVCQAHPRWAGRINAVLERCRELAHSIPQGEPSIIHRDFYPDHVLVNGSRIWLLDFDLCSHGDPALDIGNFLGHLSELSLRTHGNPASLAHLELALENEFARRAGPGAAAAVPAYACLTLARHVYLSTQFPDRHPFTERLVAGCEERLAAFDRGTRPGHGDALPFAV